jgi:hypothetical protein
MILPVRRFSKRLLFGPNADKNGTVEKVSKMENRVAPSSRNTASAVFLLGGVRLRIPALKPIQPVIVAPPSLLRLRLEGATRSICYITTDFFNSPKNVGAPGTDATLFPHLSLIPQMETHVSVCDLYVCLRGTLESS